MTIREGLETLPPKMIAAALPVDDRGYVVPWFVDWVDGKPEFRAMDAAKLLRAIKEKLCWVCGGRLGVNYTFVAGPMCGINRTDSEPPSHRECAEWSARNCPFLSNPKMVRREDEQINNQMVRENAAGMAITRNPGVVMLWHTRSYDIWRHNGILFQMGEPESVDWYTCGRAATRAEVLQSIDSGIPALQTLAREEPGGVQALAEARKRFEKWLPTQ